MATLLGGDSVTNGGSVINAGTGATEDHTNGNNTTNTGVDENSVNQLLEEWNCWINLKINYFYLQPKILTSTANSYILIFLLFLCSIPDCQGELFLYTHTKIKKGRICHCLIEWGNLE